MAPSIPLFTPTKGTYLGPEEFYASLDEGVDTNVKAFAEYHSSSYYEDQQSFFESAFCGNDDSSITREDLFGARIVHRTEMDIDSEHSRPHCHVEDDSNLDGHDSSLLVESGYGPESSDTSPTRPGVSLSDVFVPDDLTLDTELRSSNSSASIENHIKHDTVTSLLLETEPTTSDNKIMRDRIKADLDEEMLQDTIAILKFQSLVVLSEQDRARLRKDIPIMMTQWATQRLADILSAPEDQSIVDSIYNLHQLILSRIKDYLNKATSDFLPRAYRGLPVVDSGLTYTGHPKFEGEFDLDLLNKSGRKLLFWAFLRHELMSKVRLYVAILRRDYRPPVELNRRGGHKFLPWEDEAIRCVQTYIQTLYTALFAEWSGAELPDSPPPGLGRSNSMVETAQWVEALTEDESVCATATARLPAYGLEPIMSLMEGRQQQQGQQASIELTRALLRNARFRWDYEHAHKETVSGNFDKKKGLVPELWKDIVRRHGTPRNYTQENLALLRQRAWVFFWDSPAHPQHEALLNISQEASTELSGLKGWERSFFQEEPTNEDSEDMIQGYTLHSVAEPRSQNTIESHIAQELPTSFLNGHEEHLEISLDRPALEAESTTR